MAIAIGLIVQWPDGIAGTIQQEGLALDPSRDAWWLALLAKRDGYPDIRGRLRYTDEGIDRVPGEDDVTKSNAIRAKLAEHVRQNGLQDGFSFQVEADDDGVQLVGIQR